MIPLKAIPEWAKKTLKAHQKDKRHYLYTLKNLKTAKTHDPYWNAAQKEMVIKGKDAWVYEDVLGKEDP